MKRLTGYDAAFLYDERPNEPQHTLKVCIYGEEASAAYRLGDGLAEARAFVSGRLPELPPLRWRALHVPFDLDHPVWVDDREPDLEYHVRGRALPQPARRGELCEAISEISSTPLDPSRPLWELWMLEGYEASKVVAVLKMSHALADGAASKRLLETLFASPPADLPAPAQGEVGEATPSKWALVADALRDRASAGRELLRLGRATHVARRALRENPVARLYHGRRISLLASPPTPFSGRPSKKRAFHFVTLPLDAAREVGRGLGCTVTDTMLATTAGGLREYLKHHRALPGLPTLAHMPASIRTGAEQREWGNRITTRPLTLPTHIPDPIERLRAASEIVSEAKQDLERRRGANVEDWLRWMPPFVTKGVGGLARTFVRIRPEFPGGITMTSVRGPDPLLAPGGPIENFVSVGHVKYVAGLNVTVWSYDGHLNVGLYACPTAVPDLPRLAEMIGDSFEELCKAATREAARVSQA